jgi:hypothetical protein
MAGITFKRTYPHLVSPNLHSEKAQPLNSFSDAPQHLLKQQ